MLNVSEHNGPADGMPETWAVRMRGRFGLPDWRNSSEGMFFYSDNFVLRPLRYPMLGYFRERRAGRVTHIRIDTGPFELACLFYSTKLLEEPFLFPPDFITGDLWLGAPILRLPDFALGSGSPPDGGLSQFDPFLLPSDSAVIGVEVYLQALGIDLDLDLPPQLGHPIREVTLAPGGVSSHASSKQPRPSCRFHGARLRLATATNAVEQTARANVSWSSRLCSQAMEGLGHSLWPWATSEKS